MWTQADRRTGTGGPIQNKTIKTTAYWRNMKRITQIILLLLTVFSVSAFASGCGGQTEQANALVDEVNAIAAVVEPKLDQANKLLLQATDQLSQGKIEEEKASLTQAQTSIDGIIGDIRTAKSKTD